MEENKNEQDGLFEDVLPQDTQDVEEQNDESKTSFNEDMPPSKLKRRNVKTAVLSVAIALIFFVLGGFTVWLTLDKDLLSLMKIKKAIDEHYYQEIDDEQFYGALISGINNNLLDAYSRYMTADEYSADKNDMAGKRIGIGGVFSTKDSSGKEQMLVTRVSGNSPAEAAGLLAGDYVTAFGKTETELTESVVFQQFSDFLQTCAEGEDFFVRVRRGAEDKILKMSRQAYVENYLFYRTSNTAYAFGGQKASTLEEKGAPLPFLDEDTAYIRLVQFAGSVSKRFDELMNLFKDQGKKHLVLDLRENGGGYLDIMQHLSQYFCKNSTDKKPLVVVADYGEKQEKFNAVGNKYYDYFSEDSRIYVIADSGTASASECLIGCMVDYGVLPFSNICLVERNGKAKTYGKGIMQTTFLLGIKGDAIRLTTAEIHWPVSGRSIHGRGVLPEDGAKTVAENFHSDAEIAAAWAVLTGQNS